MNVFGAAFGGHPHQSKIGSEEPIFDSFSLKGEALGGNSRLVSYNASALDTGQGFSPRGDTPGWPLLPFGQFTFSCQPPALRNRGLTDVGLRRRRQQYASFYCINLMRNENILDMRKGRVASNFATRPFAFRYRRSVFSCAPSPLRGAGRAR